MPRFTRQMRPIIPLMLILLAACDTLAPTAPTLTPTRALSGPTQIPTATIDVRPPTRDANTVIGGTGQNSGDTADIPAESNAPPFSVTPVPGQEAPIGGRLVQITLEDGTQQVGDLYEAESNPATLALPPGVLLIAPDRNGWGNLPRRLNAAGLTVLVIAPRAGATSSDFTTIMQVFSALITVDPGSMGAIGAEAGADLALIGCAVEPLCDTLALITPLTTDTLLNIMPSYSPRAALIVAAEGDASGSVTANALIQVASPESGFQSFPGNERGTALVAAQPTLASLLVEWMAARLGA